MDINKLKEDYKLKRTATKREFTLNTDTEENVEIALKQLYEDYKNGKNTYITLYAYIQAGLCSYNIYSRDFDGKTFDEVCFSALAQHRDMQRSEIKKLHIHNGIFLGRVSDTLTEKMAEDFYGNPVYSSDSIYVYKGHDGITAIFDQYFADERSVEEFKDEATLMMTGLTLDELKEKYESKKIQEEKNSDKIDNTQIAKDTTKAGIGKSEINEIIQEINKEATRDTVEIDEKEKN